MGEQRDDGIGWCHYTFNAWEGCHKISPACTHCYAAELNGWLRGGENWGFKNPRRFFGEAHWRKPLAWHAVARKAEERRRVFCGSIMDIGERHPVPGFARSQDEARDRLWSLIAQTGEWLDWLLLTKRIEDLATMLPWVGAEGHSEPWESAWIGVTAENDEYAQKRIDRLRRVPAVRRFVSYEPALGPIDWSRHLHGEGRPDLVIFGDESGKRRRPAELAWARETRDACAAAGVAFYFKQWHGDGVDGERDKKRKVRLPILDGRRHDAMPESVQ